MNMQPLKDAIRAISLNIASAGDDRKYKAQLKRLGEAQQSWWRHENVVGVCIARKRRAGKLGALCVQVLVRRKFATHKLAPKHRVPLTLESPAFKRAPRTDIRAVGDLRLDSLVTEKRPAHPGFDIGNEVGESGTIGCVVVDQQGNRRGLSCAHVLAPDGQADVGAAFGSVVLCPSLPSAQALGVLAEAPIGTLVRVLAPSFDPNDADTNLDVALFAPNDPASLSAIVADVDVKPTGINDNVAHGTKVHKVGAFSAETWGAVQGIELLTKIPYGNDIALFSKHIVISAFAQPGDSGALVLDEQNRAVGIHIGSAQGMSICTPIRRILDALQCRLE
jgi:hypothetical protein